MKIEPTQTLMQFNTMQKLNAFSIWIQILVLMSYSTLALFILYEGNKQAPLS